MLNKDFQLKDYNTFGIQSVAREFFTFKKEEELSAFFSGGKLQGEKILILGGGSNILFTGNFNGLIIHPDIQGICLEEKNDKGVLVSAGAGVIWDDFVEWCVEKGYSGIENLSFIPGTVGATPVQNIGAYGVEAANSIERVRFISLIDGKISEINKEDCHFGYRDSIFKHELKRKVVVTKVWYRLAVDPVLNTSYGDVEKETIRLGGINLKNIRQAIINIRRFKLPDPSITGNAGSFFKNPVIESEQFEQIKLKFPDIPSYDLPEGKKKLAAGWLIDRCGWKGYRKGNVGVHSRQALVLVNYGVTTGEEIVELAKEIQKSVKDHFDIDLSPEVEII